MAEVDLESGQTNTDTGDEGNKADDTSSTILTGSDDKSKGSGGDEGGKNEGGDKGDKGGSEKAGGDNKGSDSDSDNKSNGDDDTSDSVPESYEFNMPEGMEADKTLVEVVAPVFKELGLSQEKADKLTTAYAETMSAQSKAIDDAFIKQQDDWKNELKNDQKFGGDKFDENCGKVAEFINKTCPPEIMDDMKQLLSSSGAANNPAMVKYFHSLALAYPVSEDTSESGRASAGKKKSLEERMYPDD